MAVTTAVDELADAVRAADAVIAVGGGTHREVGNPPRADAVAVRAPAGVIAYEPADLTVTVGAGTTEAELAEVLGAHAQECALNPRSDQATVGGMIATGLSGYRRLRHGPLRDRVLEVRFVNANGDVVKGGGPTVKNVSGFDIPRLLVGSLGTIGVLTQVTLRCQPVDRVSEWSASTNDPVAVLRRGYRPSCVLWDGRETRVLVEGVTADVEAELLAMGTNAGSSIPAFPDGPHRGRASVRPSAVAALAVALDRAGVRWLAEIGVGTVHVAADSEGDLAAARAAAESAGGWLLRETGAPGLDGFGEARPNAGLQARIRAAFDPAGKFSPARGWPEMSELLEHHAPVAPRPRGILPVDEDELVACVACGLCLPHCPTYRVSGLESESPRGRIAAMREVELEGAPVDAAFVASMETCVQCRGCETACPSTVPFGHLMEGTREALAARAAELRPWWRRIAEWAAFAVVLPRHRLLVTLTWCTLVGQRLRLVPRRFGLPKLSARSLRTPLVADSSGDAVLFPGCVMDAWQRDVHRAALTVMRAAGARPTLPGRGADCCGALHAHAGRISEARRLARRMIASMRGDTPIVVDSAGCGAAMKDYGRLLGTPEAIAFSARVQDFSEWLAAQPRLALRETGTVAVVQDPCHLRHVQHAQGFVRTVLAPAYTLRETDDDGLCCGAGGAYAVVQPKLAGAIRTRKVQAIRRRAGGIDSRDERRSPLVVSANPGCAMHLAAAGITVRHPAELLADALEKPPSTAMEAPGA